MATKANNRQTDSTAKLGLEVKVPVRKDLAADKLRNNMDAAEYKHVVLGLIFLKYISDTLDIRTSAFGIRPVPPKRNANFAWVQHFIHHLAPQGMAGFVLGKMKRDTAIANFSLN